jgi:hypothetical protein
MEVPMLSARLVRMIEDHAEQLTRGLVHQLKTHKQTPHYLDLPEYELHNRVYDVYRNLGEWLTYKSDETIRLSYVELGKRRFAEKIPLSEVVYALILTKRHVWEYIQYAGLLDSAIELYQEQELRRLLAQFFDNAVYSAVCGYEREAASRLGEASHRGAVA